MKKFLSVLLTAVMVFSLAGCQSKTAPEEKAATEEPAVTTPAADVTAESTEETLDTAQELGPTMQKIKDSGVFTIGCDLAFPPFSFVDPASGESYGIAVEVGQKVADKLGVKLEIIPEAFGALLSDLQTGKLDMVAACVTVTDERKQVMLFSDPYIQTADAMLVKTENADLYKTLDDFKGKTIAANNGTSQYTHGESIEGTVMVGKDSTGDAVMEVLGGSADAAVVDNVNGKQYVAANDGALTIIDSAVFDFNDKAVAVQLGNEDLVEIINEVISEMKPDMDNLVDKYIDLSIELLGN